MKKRNWETTDVLICGCGPTGALLSVYLGQMSISNVVLEREAEVTTDPRGIALDEDGIRLLQGAGLYNTIYTQTGTCKWLLQKPSLYLVRNLTGEQAMQNFNFISGTQKDLDAQPFLSMDYGTVSVL